ncbi:MAG: hypothetical protein SVY53_03410 [Chloroflexota bacterium]|nr:hypothetical protein [Chloroflexota bacterium]
MPRRRMDWPNSQSLVICTNCLDNTTHYDSSIVHSETDMPNMREWVMGVYLDSDMPRIDTNLDINSIL